jgi:hypothetical protein
LLTSSVHPLEKQLNAPAADILEAIEHGFRARADVKGKLAELYLFRHLQQLRVDGRILSIQWHDSDGQPDFETLMQDGRKLRVECKNLRSSSAFSAERGCKVEIQKTRGGLAKEGRKTRGYLASYFDLLAACTFNQTSEWRFRFIATCRLARRDNDPKVLKVMQVVPLTGSDKFWFDDFLMAVQDAKD